MPRHERVALHLYHARVAPPPLTPLTLPHAHAGNNDRPAARGHRGVAGGRARRLHVLLARLLQRALADALDRLRVRRLTHSHLAPALGKPLAASAPASAPALDAALGRTPLTSKSARPICYSRVRAPMLEQSAQPVSPRGGLADDPLDGVGRVDVRPLALVRRQRHLGRRLPLAPLPQHLCAAPPRVATA